MKKFLSYFLIASLFFTLGGCQNSTSIKNEKPKVLASIFPIYDWTREILKDNPGGIECSLLLDKGTDLHNFQPSTDDMIAISKADLFIYVGGESDEWVESALKNSVNKNQVTMNLLERLGDKAKEEQEVEGMQEEEHEHHHHEEENKDEHIWLSLHNAILLCEQIKNELCTLDPTNQDYYEKNYLAYKEKLSSLDQKYETMVHNAKRNVILLPDRFPFLYLVEDYGLSYYAAFKGCSAETEASFETVRFLSEKLNELSLPSVIILEGSEEKLAQTIISNSTQKDISILVLDSMQSITSENIMQGVTYLSIMEKNYEILERALN